MFTKAFVEKLIIREKMSAEEAVFQRLMMTENELTEYFEKKNRYCNYGTVTQLIEEWAIDLDIRDDKVASELRTIDDVRMALSELESREPYRSSVAKILKVSMRQLEIILDDKREDIPYPILSMFQKKLTPYFNGKYTLSKRSVDDMWKNVSSLSHAVSNPKFVKVMAEECLMSEYVLKQSLTDEKFFKEYLIKAKRMRLDSAVTTIKFQKSMKQKSITQIADEIANKVIANLSSK